MMEALTGLSLDAATPAPGGNLPPVNSEAGTAFDVVFDGELSQLQAVDLATLALISLDEMPDNDAETANESSADAPAVDHSLVAQNVSLLLTAQHQVVSKIDAPTLENSPDNAATSIASPALISASSTPASTTESTDENGQTKVADGNPLPLKAGVKLSRPVATKVAAMTSRETDTPVNELLEEDAVEQPPLTEISELENVATPLSRRNEINTTAEFKAKDAVALNHAVQTATKSASAAITVAATEKSPLLSVSDSVALTRAAAVSTTFTARSDLVVAARGGDISKWLNHDDKGAAVERAEVAVSPLVQRHENAAAPEAMLPNALRLPLFGPRFNDVISNQVLWLSKQGISQASIHLHPAELGPITVKLTQVGQETSVQFVVAHPTTKEQLEQALPRLRDVFQHGGLQLVDVDVQDGRKQPQGEHAESHATTLRTPSNNSAMAANLLPPTVNETDGIIDFYA